MHRYRKAKSEKSKKREVCLQARQVGRHEGKGGEVRNAGKKRGRAEEAVRVWGQGRQTEWA